MLLISALPHHPNDYAALPANFGPRPRTVKMVRIAVTACLSCPMSAGEAVLLDVQVLL